MTSATERVRELLDERGVEWDADDAKTVRVTRWGAYGDWVSFIEYDNGDTKFCIDARRLTPEQAIEATLGSCNCSNDCTDSERTRVCLPHWWTHDGALHVELPKLPDSISVRLPDQRDREVRSARVWQFTRDSGTCREVYLLMATDIGDGREEVLGVYATEEAAMAAINENQFGYALHHVRKWEVDE